MYFDFEDHRPDTPRVPRRHLAARGRAAVASIAVHLLWVIAILLLPDRLVGVAGVAGPAAAVRSTTSPLRRRSRRASSTPAPPKRPADASDLDRRSATRERAPEAGEHRCRSRAATRPSGSRAPTASGTDRWRRRRPRRPRDATAAAAPPTVPPKLSPDGARPPRAEPRRPASADSLRNLQRYLAGPELRQPAAAARPNRTPTSSSTRRASTSVRGCAASRAGRSATGSSRRRRWSLSGRVVIQFYVHARRHDHATSQIVQPSRVDAVQRRRRSTR